MKSNFDTSFTALMGSEGGYSNNPSDPGGETMWGITLTVARANGYQGPMMDLPQDTAKVIAKLMYWDTVNADNLPDKVDFQVFDASYNSGPGQAIKWLQNAVDVNPDGKLGTITMQAIKLHDPSSIVIAFNAIRLMFFTNLSTWNVFGKGWARRIANNLSKAV